MHFIFSIHHAARGPGCVTVIVDCRRRERQRAAGDDGVLAAGNDRSRRRGAVAAFDYACKEVSSHDPRKKDPADPAGWHSNQDYGNFIRLETNQDRREWVILDTGGPGAIIRIWVPRCQQDQQIVRFYFEGSSDPAIAVKLNELLAGQSFARPPLAFISWNEPDLREELKPDYKATRGVGGDLYLPIPFAKSCKVTLDSVPFYYCFNYRLYVPSTPVKTFTMTDYEAAKTAVNQAGATLLADPAMADNTLNKQSTLAPGEELSIDLPRGSAAVRNLEAQVLAADAPRYCAPSYLKRLLTVSQPFGVRSANSLAWEPGCILFMTGAEASPRTEPRARWVMPYQHSGRLALKNLGHKPARVKLAQAPARGLGISCHFIFTPIGMASLTLGPGPSLIGTISKFGGGPSMSATRSQSSARCGLGTAKAMSAFTLTAKVCLLTSARAPKITTVMPGACLIISVPRLFPRLSATTRIEEIGAAIPPIRGCGCWTLFPFTTV